jgi:rod shape-determining protein MreD
MKKNKLILAIIIMVILVIAETTLMKKLPNKFIYPDIVLIVLVFFSNNKGNFEGQISGFIAGMAEDFLSLSPPGFNSFIKIVIGFIFGKLKGKIFIDPILFPVIMIFFAGIIKGLIAVLIATLFLKPEISPVVFTPKFAIEIVENCIAAPFVFALMKLSKLYTIEERGF